jgi:hypothetical protein
MSWRMSIDRWSELPDRRTDPSDTAELAEGWLAWWQSLVGADPPALPLDPSDPPVAFLFGPPAFSGFHDFLALRQAAVGRWEEAHRWHSAGKRAGLASGLHLDLDNRDGQVVAEVENELGRTARPFSLDLVVLPVHDDEIRPVGRDRYLIPERVYDGSRWPDLLRSLVTPIA